MAGNDVIGSVRALLGLDTAQFDAGLRQARGELGRFGKLAASSFAVAGTAALAAGVALGVMVKRQIDAADEMGKMAQKAGVSVEALSRLKHAADLSDVSLEGLGTGLRKLSQNMLAVAQGTGGTAKTAFDALGISVKNADGTLRSSTSVLGDVADKFARMDDGATKTALAVNVFGKSGADLIPMLNAGSAGLAEMAAESDRLGLTLDSKTTGAAERFNDNLTRVGGILEGVTNKVMIAVLPALEQFSNTLASPEFASAAQTLAVGVVGALDLIAQAISTVINGLDSIRKWMEAPVAQAFLFDKLVETAPQAANDLRRRLKHGAPDAAGLYEGFSFGADGNMEVATPEAAKPFVPNIVDPATLDAINEAEEALKRLGEQGQALEFSLKSPFDMLQYELDNLGNLLNAKAIDWDTFAAAAARAKASTVGQMADMASGIMSSLSGLFEGNKQFAVATAVVDGISAVAKAFAAYPPPFNFAAAAAAGVGAAANVAALLSTSETSSSMPSTAASSGGSGVPSVATPESPSASAGTAIKAVFKGGGRYSRDEIEQIFAGINEVLGDGAKFNREYI